MSLQGNLPCLPKVNPVHQRLPGLSKVNPVHQRVPGLPKVNPVSQRLPCLPNVTLSASVAEPKLFIYTILYYTNRGRNDLTFIVASSKLTAENVYLKILFRLRLWLRNTAFCSAQCYPAVKGYRAR